MNIFAVDPRPEICASYLDDKRVNKMTTETAQMLCTAVRYWHNDPQNLDVNGNLHTIYVVPSDIVKSGELAHKELYVNTHINHPCTVWARQCRSNFLWLLQYFKCLLDEFEARFGKPHASGRLLEELESSSHVIPKGSRTPFPNCTTDYGHVSNVYHAYRLQLDKKWREDKREPKWTKLKKS